MQTATILLTLGSLLATGATAKCPTSAAPASSSATFTTDPSCESSLGLLLAGAPEFPDFLAQADFPAAASLLSDPEAYASALCSAAAKLPASDLDGFQTYGASLLHFASVEIQSYDELVTKCFVKGPQATVATDYIHSIVSTPDGLCQPAATATGGPAATGTSSP
ncbi:hypothetical protein F4808DRAFT_326143 [Astrocystis sublimbata]|nr:hypothetical protein F4808DRAFT_326143 [Astrocystis sublimbata]